MRPIGLRSGIPVILQIHLVQPRYHLVLAVTNTWHINREAIASDAKLQPTAKVGCDLCTVDDVFAWQARDVRARPANVFAVDHGDALSLSSEGPGSDGRARAATENRSKSSGWVCFSTWVNELFSVLFMWMFLSERPIQS